MLAGGAQAQTVTVDGITYTVEGGAETATVSDAYEGLTAAHVLATVEIDGKVYPVADIGESAFYDCMSLESVALPQGLRGIHDSAFFGCTSLESVTVPEGVAAIGGKAFSACTSLASVTLPEGLESIGGSAFSYCLALPSITLPSTLVGIGEAAFSGCSALESIVLPPSVEVVSDLAFQSCARLADVTLPEGLAAIGEFAFADCQSLEDITLPSTLQSIGNCAFNRTPLAGITCLATVPPVLDGLPFDQEHYMEAELHVPAEAEPAYRAAKGWMEFFEKAAVDGILYVLNPGTRTASVMDGTSASGALSIPATVQYEGEDYAVTSISGDAFYACMGLTAITIPEGVTTIGSEAFGACRFLESASLPSTLAEIDDYAFGGCTSLHDINWPDGLRIIGESAFEECTSLERIALPAGLAEIGDYGFCSCIALQEAVLPAGLRSLGRAVFADCPSLESVALPEELQNIGHDAFVSCTSLASIALPEGLQEIGSGAFYDCPLADVYSYAAVPPAIAADTFDESTYAEAALHVPSDVAASYGSAEYWKQFLRIDGDLPSTGIGSVAAGASLAVYADGMVAATGLADITVYAQNGAQALHADGVASLSLEGLPRGIYIINVEQGGQHQVLKVMR